MSTFHRIALGVLVASLAASVVASMLFSSRVALWCGMPALVMSAWAAIGHLVTIDDDAAGGWSNPDGSSQIWYQSLRDLAIKLVVALFVAWLVVGAPLAQDAA
jgi:hypothetical protein